MADEKLSALTDGTAPASGDLFYVARSGSQYKISWDELIAALPGVDGWINDAAETWTYASGSGGGTATFTVPGDVTAKYSPGTRIKLTQTTVKYFVVSGSVVAAGTTTVTITAGTDYTLANAAISANYHSYSANPQGYPGWFNYTPTWTGYSANPTVVVARFSVGGRMCTVDIQTGPFGTSNSTSHAVSIPISHAGGQDMAVGRGVDNGADVGAMASLSGTTATLLKGLTFSSWTASGSKGFTGVFSYGI